MKKRLTVLMLLLCGPLTALAQNPIIQTHYTADPAPMVYHDTLFLYVGCDEPGAPRGTYLMREYRLYTTTDMVNWTDCGAILKTSQFKWSAGDASAAQVIERDGKFYWYISSQNAVSPGSSIGVAVADSPYGPFHDPLEAGMVTNNMTTQATHSWDDLDPTVWMDDNGKAFLFWGNGMCYYAPLNPDMTSLAGPIKAIDAKDKAALGGEYTEGPWLYKRNDTYYLVYAARFPECINYSTAKNIEGPWTFRSTVMPTQKGSNTNHPGLIDYKGQSYFFYHNDALPGGHGYARSVCVEPFTYAPDGSLPEIQMTEQGIPASLGHLNPYRKVQAETIAWSEGITTVQDPQGQVYVSDIHHGDYIKVREVDFGAAGARTFRASAASRYLGGKVELRLDGTEGTPVGTLTIPFTGEWDSWREISTPVQGAQGVHDLYLVFTGRQPLLLFNLDYWQFD